MFNGLMLFSIHTDGNMLIKTNDYITLKLTLTLIITLTLILNLTLDLYLKVEHRKEAADIQINYIFRTEYVGCAGVAWHGLILASINESADGK